MHKPSFDTFLAQLKPTNTELDTLCDLDKVRRNVQCVERQLLTLDTLLHTTDIEGTVKQILAANPRAFSVLPLLLALRPYHCSQPMIDSDGNSITLNQMLQTPEGVMRILRETGLYDVFSQRMISSVYDYAFGIEMGLDSNARKNRGGHAMERIVAVMLQGSGLAYLAEVYSRQWPSLHQSLGQDEKRFDFALLGGERTYLIEVNFYNTSGSKLNEVARAYSELAPRVNAVPGFTFVWVTDGQGWLGARNKLGEAYQIIPDVYNLTTFPQFLNQLTAPGHD